MGPRRELRVADPAEPALHVVPEPLERGREEHAVLEAVAAAAATHELRLHRVQRDPRVLVEQDVDVVERERPDVRLVEGVQRLP